MIGPRLFMIQFLQIMISNLRRYSSASPDMILIFPKINSLGEV